MVGFEIESPRLEQILEYSFLPEKRKYCCLHISTENLDFILSFYVIAYPGIFFLNAFLPQTEDHQEKTLCQVEIP